MTPRDKYFLLFVLGLVLVLNPVYLFSNGVPSETDITYRAEEVERVLDVDHLPFYSILSCSKEPLDRRECVQAHQVGYGGRLGVNNDSKVVLEDDETGLHFDYDFVRFDQGYAKPNASIDGGRLVLSFDPVSQKQVLSKWAVPFKSVPQLGKQAIRNGTASTTRDHADHPLIDDHLRIVNQSGTFYRLEPWGRESQRLFPPWILPIVRIIGVIGGATLSFVASGRYVQLNTTSSNGFFEN
ncbi:hypothetical protein [Halapricum desulfuricans]|uniref:Uncharacterized protein n=1 Tax=Halapricum desulfuricans TaxID=2841257 RepID=A0A897N5Y3_9EURY|nr:hypothetical protein [Halapricum desulfuricans]QSG06623.1 Uncharacterized protein HSR121_2295 [Halapricum desulfuricans]